MHLTDAASDGDAGRDEGTTMSQTKTAKAAKWCVFAAGWENAAGRSGSYGDGITSGTRRIFGVFDSEAEAEAALAGMMRSRTMTRSRMPGDGIDYPELEVGEFDALRFVGRQDRDQVSGKRLLALVNDLYERGRENAAAL